LKAKYSYTAQWSSGMILALGVDCLLQCAAKTAVIINHNMREAPISIIG
jgi:hypothetical protein